MFGKDSPEAKVTRRKVRQAQGEMNAFIESNGLKKLPYRTLLTAR
jgi:hypothetical protein